MVAPQTQGHQFEEIESRVNTFQSIANLGHWEWDYKKNVLSWSDEVFSIFGVNKDEFEVSPENFEKYIHPEDLDSFISTREASLLNSKESKLEHRIIRPNGEVRYIVEKGRIIRNDNGEPLWIVGTIQDVTEFQTKRIELQQQNNYLEKLLSTVPSAVFTVDENKNITSWNRRASAITGYDADEVIGHPCDIFALTPCNEQCGLLDESVMKPILGKYCTIRRKDGVMVNILKNVDVMRDKDDTFITGIECFDDLSAMYEIQQALAVEKERLANIIEGTNVGTWEWHIESGATTFNERWAGIIGYTLEELEPYSIDTWIAMTHPDDLVISNERLERHFKGELPYYECECRMLHRDGHWVWVFDRGKVSRWSEDGNPLVMHGTHQDISERKALELEILLSKEKAEVANVSKSRFLANMSHEIRTPMNGIMGYLELLEKSELTDVQKLYVDEARCSSDILLHLINDILDLSKIEAGKVSIEYVPFNLHHVVENCISTYVPKAITQDITLNLYIDKSVPLTVVGDSARLTQILGNLISNAIKFTKAGSVSVSVSRKNPNTVSLSVTDTGIGMSDSIMNGLFKPFVQGDDSTTRKYGGTGLGLAITKELIVLMGGSVQVESTEGVGSVFTVDLPFSILNEYELNKELLDSYDEFRVAYGKTNPKALIVDQDVTFLNNAKQYLNDYGIVAETCEKGAEAVSRLLQSRSLDNGIDILILGSNINDIRVNDIIAILGIIPSEKRIPTLCCGYLHEQSRMKSELSSSSEMAGFDGYIQRPVKRESFIASIIETCNRVYGQSIYGNELESERNQYDGESGGHGNEASENLEASGVMDIKTLSDLHRILIVDDSEMSRKMLQLFLLDSGFKCDSVPDGRAAIELYKRHHYPIVLMDCMMPEIDGYETTRRIREYEQGAGHKSLIIALTANAMEGDRERCFEAGMDDYLTKPLDFKSLIDMLTTFMSDGFLIDKALEE